MIILYYTQNNNILKVEFVEKFVLGFDLSNIKKGIFFRDAFDMIMYYFLGFKMFACAAARRAIGTLNGEQDT
jgi:hypothetical protein